jgi:hypothetical protein
MNLAEAASRLPDGPEASAIAPVWTDSPTEAAIHVFESAERHVVIEVLAFNGPMTKAEFEAQDWVPLFSRRGRRVLVTSSSARLRRGAADLIDISLSIAA